MEGTIRPRATVRDILAGGPGTAKAQNGTNSKENAQPHEPNQGSGALRPRATARDILGGGPVLPKTNSASALKSGAKLVRRADEPGGLPVGAQFLKPRRVDRVARWRYAARAD